MSSSINHTVRPNLRTACTAHNLNSTERQGIGIQAIKGHTPITDVAIQHNVSRKFVYEQKDKALDGISKAFEEESKDSQEKVLYTISVTKKWLEQVLLGLTFTCRSSYQGSMEFFRDILNYETCKGTIHNILYKHLEKAKAINHSRDLSKVAEGLHDEIYQSGDPVLVGCCAKSTYCYLLSLEDSCDANSWGVHLLDLAEKQKLAPDFTVIDGGASARKGQQEAWPDIPAHGDVFHALKPFLELVTYIDNRAMDALKMLENLENKNRKRRVNRESEEDRQKKIKELKKVKKISEEVVSLSEELGTLYRWLKNDILSLVGPSYEDRKKLLEFIVEELRLRENQCPHRIEPVRKYLENHTTNLLEFVPMMDDYFYEISQEFEVPLSDVLSIYQLAGLPTSSQRRWEAHARLQSQLGEKFYWVESMVNKVLGSTVRANSLVENLNSRLRTYFTLRRELGNEYLEFLQFFLNHRRFMRSECRERVGKSPAELLTGEKHKHWLEMLGFELFKAAA